MNNANVNNASLNSACKSGNLETFLSGRVFYDELRYPRNQDTSHPSKSAASSTASYARQIIFFLMKTERVINKNN